MVEPNTECIQAPIVVDRVITFDYPFMRLMSHFLVKPSAYGEDADNRFVLILRGSSRG